MTELEVKMSEMAEEQFNEMAEMNFPLERLAKARSGKEND